MRWRTLANITLKAPWLKWGQKMTAGEISSTNRALAQEKCDANFGCQPDEIWNNLGEKHEG